jgi:sulfate adenylyltransferase subunit 2
MDRLDQLESQSIYIFREAFNRIENIAMLWSLGKDSNVMIWLARKAFFGHVPFPVMHVDTEKKFPEMYDFRDRYADEWNLNFIRELCPPIEEVDQTLPPAARSASRKTAGLKAAIQKHQFNALFAGIRRDEEATRAKERVFSPRGQTGQWDFRDQPPEFWDQFKTEFPPGPMCACIRCCTGRRSTSGSTRSVRTFRSFRSILQRTESATARWATRTSPIRWRAKRRRSRRSSKS